jgi:hypothetical protein
LTIEQEKQREKPGGRSRAGLYLWGMKATAPERWILLDDAWKIERP